MSTTSEISSSLQESVLTALCFGSEKSNAIANIVKPEHFLPPLDDIARKAIEYRQRFGEAPGEGHLDDVMDHIAADDRQAETYRYVLVGMMRQKDHLNEDYVLSRLPEFLRRAKQMDVIERAGMRIQQGGENVSTEVDEILDELRQKPDTEAAPDISVAWPSMSPEAFHGLAGDVVRTIAPHSEVDPVALLASYLAAFGNCVGRNAYYQVEGAPHHPNLFVCIVGDSAKSRKGSSWAHIARLFRRVDPEWSKNVESGLSSGEGLIWRVRDEQDNTDRGVTDKRVLVQEPELATVLRRAEREGSSLSQLLRCAWDGNRLSVMTKKTPYAATDASISVVGHITLDELRRYLVRTEIASGFANRFLLLLVKRAQSLPFGGRLPEEKIDELAQRTKAAIEHAKDRGELSWSPEAVALWANIYDSLSEPEPGMAGVATARAEAQCVRLALCYALLDCADHIEVDHLKAALALVVYGIESARFIFGNSLGDPVMDRVLEEIEKAGNAGVRKSKLTEMFGKHPDAWERLERALDHLTKSGRIIAQRIPTGGRPETRYCASERQ